jgi:hypothetical protein
VSLTNGSPTPTKRPQLVEADVRAFGRDSGFDPKRTNLVFWPTPRHLVVAGLVLALRWEMLKWAAGGRALVAQASLR